MDEIKRVASGGEWGEGECVVRDLLHLPHKIQQHHDVAELAHLVLHDLSHDGHFGLNRAIYLIDNPEFNCLKGVAGFNKDECRLHQKNVWEKPHVFADDMNNAQFHKTIKGFAQDASVCCRDVGAVRNPDDLVELGGRLGLKNPSFFVWNMRHGNHGILLFEDGQTCARRRDLLQHAASLLSLC